MTVLISQQALLTIGNFPTNVTTAIDDSNELLQNVINNTAVANVDFTANYTTGAPRISSNSYNYC